MRCPMRRDPVTQEFGDCVETCAWRAIIDDASVCDGGRLKYRKMAVCAVANTNTDKTFSIPMEVLE